MIFACTYLAQCLNCVLNVKALVGALKQEKALSVVVKSSTIVRLKLQQIHNKTDQVSLCVGVQGGQGGVGAGRGEAGRRVLGVRLPPRLRGRGPHGPSGEQTILLVSIQSERFPSITTCNKQRVMLHYLNHTKHLANNIYSQI